MKKIENISSPMTGCRSVTDLLHQLLLLPIYTQEKSVNLRKLPCPYTPFTIQALPPVVTRVW